MRLRVAVASASYAERMAGPGSAEAPVAAGRSRRGAIAQIAVFDVGGPLVLYAVLRGQGFSTVSALVISGILPAAGVALNASVRRRVDVIGVLVLAGIAVGTVLGLTTRNAHLVLLEGSVPTALFGLACLVSLWTQRPLMYRMAVEFLDRDSPRGREFEDLWRYAEFRRTFRVITAAWGAGFLVEAAIRVLVVENTSTGTALAATKALPYVVFAALGMWTAIFGSRQRRKGEELARQRVEVPQETA